METTVYVYVLVSLDIWTVFPVLIIITNTGSRISPETLEGCSSNLTPEMYIIKEKMTPVVPLS